MFSDFYVTTDSVMYFVIEMMETIEILGFMLRHR